MRIVRRATQADLAAWLAMDPRAVAADIQATISAGLGYVITQEEQVIGLMRYVVLWGKLPFLTTLRIADAHQRQGHGRFAMAQWEADMRAAGYQMVLLSTQADETAQHFYRRLGYQDCGCLVLSDCPLAQPAELFFCKTL